MALGLSLAPRPAAAEPDDAHLLAGVRAFQEGRYDEALVELRVVERAPGAPADLSFYLGPTLYKLGRYREALVVFRRSRVAGDALTDYYLGQTLYQLALYNRAREVFAGAVAHGLGPRLEQGARRYLAVIDGLYARPPGTATIDAYLEAGQRLLARGEALLAVEYLDEARLVEARLAPHRHDEILLALARAQREGAPAGPSSP